MTSQNDTASAEKEMRELDIPVRSASLDQLNKIWDRIKEKERES